MKYLRTFATPSFCPHFLWHPGNQRPIKKCKYFCKTKLFSVFCWRQDLLILAALLWPTHHTRWKCEGGDVTFDPWPRHIPVIKTDSDAEETRPSLERLSSQQQLQPREWRELLCPRHCIATHKENCKNFMKKNLFIPCQLPQHHQHHPATGQQYDLLSNNVLLYVSSMCQPDPVTTNVHCGTQQHTGRANILS